MYSHPAIATEYSAPRRYRPGDIVEHKSLLGTPLVIIGAAGKSLDGDSRWLVRTPDGKMVPVVEKNLIR